MFNAADRKVHPIPRAARRPAGCNVARTLTGKLRLPKFDRQDLALDIGF